ncbi:MULTISPECIES: tRNA uridine-5-carboxymethylaminomethyl(34) synthesis GTPase MnmE [unclassified Butyricimonas]|uniref:tRNA uridine-5-carboxymethylaminomethyl(34) synthesis GTPase MnmE n=1 Tax=unclassified Butyricimonas TaxID=2637652 RepID=UPI000B3787D0|nr:MULTISPECIES: tRNA uridine-5-carboxymethylaminomethyl(34) synthesis GTPase MnmE [unclassified Butyricimonas]OUN66281.1 tRNA uridine-5-carboxymethylaminomethyl(34) synthesis GTPase MnmE [Butyricimonas sp. An62]
MNDQTVICAIATAPGMGAIAVIRLSGKGCIEICDRVFVSPSGKKLTDVRPNTIHFGKLNDGKELIDEVLISVFHAPHSFTGEDSIEISCHGSVYIQQRILQLLISSGARLAAPGEFTQRAFLNGKMDLSQAEAVADLIASSSAAAHSMALSQMRGGFSDELMKLRMELLHITSLLELELDFSEEDVEFADRSELQGIAVGIDTLISRLCASFSLGNVIKNGIPVAIVGNTNVGKSTLLNALLKEDRAIVSDIEGTTRDVIEDTINLQGITFRFIDTAGIRHTDDRVENMGIERTFSKIEQARVVLFLIDTTKDTEQFLPYYTQVKEHLGPDARLLILLNKTDQIDSADIILSQITSLSSGEKILPIAAKTGYNINHLVDELVSTININALHSGDVIVSNARHYEALSHARLAIERVITGLDSHLSGEFVSQDIRECLHYLGEITGQITTDEVLGNIFKNFCIGK